MMDAVLGNSKIVIRNLERTFKTKKKTFTALKNINLSIMDNEFACIVGPSGCGKSTLLRLIAGLDQPTKGTILVDDKLSMGPSAKKGMVFQNYTLFPWKTVRENIAFGLEVGKKSKEEIKIITDKYIELIGLNKFEKSYPRELSGGMKQRVALARALANSPEVLLMDEPFGALDPYTKASMQELTRKIWMEEKTTIIFITHDIDEAVYLGQSLYIMSDVSRNINAYVPIYLPQERKLDIKDSQEFIRIRQIISKVMQGSDLSILDTIYDNDEYR